MEKKKRYHVVLQGTEETNFNKPFSENEKEVIAEAKRLYEETLEDFKGDPFCDTECDWEDEGYHGGYISSREYYQEWWVEEENNQEGPLGIFEELKRTLERADRGVSVYAANLEDTYDIRQYIERAGELLDALKEALQDGKDQPKENLEFTVSFSPEDAIKMSEATGMIVSDSEGSISKDALQRALNKALQEYITQNHEPFNVQFETNESTDDCIEGFSNRESAEACIADDLNDFVNLYTAEGKEFKVLEGYTAEGYRITEIYESGGDSYSRWIRRWTEDIIASLDIYNKVLVDYQKHDAELNGCYFDFTCPGTRGIDVLLTYTSLQKVINGDDVVRIKDIKVNGDKVLGGTLVQLDDGSLDDNIPEDMTVETFLRNLAGTGVYRILDLEEADGKIVSGTLLELIL